MDSSDANKFLCVLKTHQRFMRVREIAEYLAIETGEDVDKWISKMSRKTRELKKANRIVKYQVGTRNTNVFWGSPNWINENGEIKEKFKYSTKNLTSSIKDNLLDL